MIHRDDSVGAAGLRAGCARTALVCAIVALACGDELPTAPVRPAPLPPTTGSIEIVLSIEGKDVDPDGFLVRVDDGSPRIVTHGTRVVFADLAPGAYTVRVDGIAENCTLRERNPYRTAVAAGQVRTLSFTADCLTFGTGAIRVTTTYGFKQFGVMIDGSVNLNATNGELMVTELAPGAHDVRLLLDPGACVLNGENPRSVTVAAGRTAAAHFDLTCFVTVNVTTTGANQPGRYTVCIEMLDSYYYGKSCNESVSANGTNRVEVYPVWEYRISLGDVPSHCTVRPAAHTVVVPASDSASIAFAVVCT